MAELPSLDHFRSLLQKCRETKTLAHAMHAHVCICDKGLESHQALGNHLVSVFVACGNLPFALQIFNKLDHRDESSWASVILGFTECGKSQFALTLNHQMQLDGVFPSRYTSMALLKACVSLRNLNAGRLVHADMSKKGLEGDLSLDNTLVGMYAKCGSLWEAQEVFDKLPVRSVVSWTALIAGYTEHGYGAEVVSCFEQMQLEGISPNAVTYVCCLKACASLGAADNGRRLHSELVKMGFENGHQRVGNTLVALYIKCGLFEEAEEVLDVLPVRNEVVWTALIAGYTDHGRGEEALNCFRRMQLDGSLPNAITFLCCLKACGNIGALYKGQEIHSEIDRKGLGKDLSISCALVDMYIRCGSLERAQEVFDGLSTRDVVLWNALMAGYSEHDLVKEVLMFLERMQLEGVPPDNETFICCLKSCRSSQDKGKGQEIHMEITKKGLEDDLVGSNLVDMYGKCGLVSEAQEVFNNMEVQDVVSWTALIVGYARHGLGEEARTCFEQMLLEGVSPDTVTLANSLNACGNIGATGMGQELHTEVSKMGFERELFIGNTLVDMYAKCGLLAEAQEVFENLSLQGVLPWTVMISSHVEEGENEKAFALYAHMQEQGMSPDSLTFVGILKACSNIGALQIGGTVHALICKAGRDASELFLSNALIDMYGKCGSMVDAQHVFDSMLTRDLVTWNTLILGYSSQGKCELVFNVFEGMRKAGISPDGVTFLTILSVCCHLGLVEKGKKYYEAMSKQYGIIPTIKHQTCMVDLLCNAGQLDAAVVMAQKMPFEPNLVTWTTVLYACQTWGNVELGRKAFESVMRLDRHHAPAFILMSNIYANAHVSRVGGCKEHSSKGFKLTGIEGAKL